MAIKFLNSVNADSGVLYVDAANNRVGIGTTSPAGKLHVQSSTSDGVIVRTSTNVEPFIAIQRNSGSNGVAVLRSIDGGHLYVDTGATGAAQSTKMTITAAGNVGIGTTSPNSWAQLETTGTVAVGGILYVKSSQKIQGLTAFPGGAGNLSINPDGGNVGIGTTSPTQKLEVAGNIKLSGYIVDSNSEIIDFAVNDLKVQGKHINAEFGVWARSYGTVRQMGIDGGASYMGLYTSGTEKVRIDTSGNVGIGTTSPVNAGGNASWLTIDAASGNAYSGGVAYTIGGAVKAYHYVESNYLRHQSQSGVGHRFTVNAGTQAMIINTSGNVGIGTTSPSHTLDVNGELRVGTVVPQTSADFSVRRNGANIEFGHGNRTSGYYGTIGVQGNNGMPYIALSADCESSVNTFTTRGFKGNVITTDGAGSLMFSQLTTANATGQSLTERMRINNAGNVGIGITSPLQKLHVTGASIIADGVAVVDPDVKGNTVVSGKIVDGGGWGVDSGIGGRAAGTGDTWAIGHNGISLYMAIGDGTNANSLSTFLRADSDGTIALEGYGAGYLKSDASGNITVDSDTIEDTLDSVTDRGATTTNDIGVGAITLSQSSSISGAMLTHYTNDYVYLRGGTEGTILSDNSGNNTVQVSGASNYIRFETTNGSERMRIDSSGNMLMGLTSATPTDGTNIELASSTSSRYILASTGTGGHKWTMAAGLSGGLDFYDYTESAYRMRIDSTGNVGIGTTSPTHLLTLETASSPGLKIKDTTQGATLLAFSQDSNSHVGTFSSHPLVFDTNSTERMRITSAGNVGIGTTAPNGQLAIKSGTNSDLEFFSEASGSAIQSYNRTTSTWGYLRFLAGGGEKMRIHSDGNVGIGTTNPSAVLDISGSSSSDGREFLVHGGSSGHSLEIVDRSGYTTSTANVYIQDADNLNTRASLHIKGNNGAVESLWVSSTGRTGIGTASPSEKLHVVGNVRIEGDLTVNGSYTQIDTDVNTTEQWNVTNDGTGPAVTINQTGAQDIMDVQDDGTSVFYIEDGGNVGIGTTDPNSKLHVSDTTDISMSAGSAGQFAIEGNGYTGAIALDATAMHIYHNSANRALVLGTNETAAITIHKSNQSLDFNTYGSGTFTGTAAYALAVDSSGNVIETSYIPSSSSTDFVAVAGDTMTGGLNIEVSTSNTQLKLKRTTSATGEFNIYTNTDSLFFHNVGQSTYPMMINSSGNVGIGTTSPSAKLHAKSSGNGTYILRGMSSAGTDLGGLYQSTAGDGEIYLKTSAVTTNVRISSNNVSYLNGGNVGIGTTSPAGKLAIKSPGDVDTYGDAFVLERAGTTAKLIRMYEDAADGFLELRTGADAIVTKLSGYSGTASYLLSNVGIGTTSPSAKLDVDGVIRSRGGTYAADTDTKTDVGLVIPENNFIYTADGSDYLRKLIGKTSDIITIGEAGTSLIDGINLVPGTAGGYVQIFNNSSIAAKFVDGKLGIGTTSPDEKLSVIGNTGLYGTVSGGIVSPASLRFFTSEDGAGLGDSTDSNKQKIGQITWAGKDTSLNATGEYAAIRTYVIDSNNLIQGSAGEGGQIEFSILRHDVGANPRVEYTAMTINNSANVGIGTTSPNRPLTIETNTTDVLGALKIKNAGAGDASMFFTVNASGAVWQLGIDNSDGDKFKIGQDTQNADVGVGTKLTIDSSGNVGIGTTSPSAKLHVHHTSEEVLRIDSGTTGAIHFFENTTRRGILGYSNGTSIATAADAGDMILRAESGSKLHLAIAGTSRLTVSGSNVGIGTTSPSNTLDVNGGAEINGETYIRSTSNVGLRIQTTDQGIGGNDGLRVGLNGTHAFVWQYENKPLAFATNGGQRMTISAGGNVGIGTTSPNVLLDVNKSTIGEYAYFGSGSIRQLRLSSYNTASDHAGHKINASSVNGEITLATSNVAALTVKNDQTLQFNAYTAGYLKSDASGNITVDTSTIEDTLDSVTDRGATTTNDISVGAITLTDDPASSNGTFVKVYEDTHKRMYTANLDFSFTAAGTYNFNLVFANSGGYQYELTAVNSRSGLYRNFGTLKDSSYIYWESDEDFTHRAEGDVHLISSLYGGMYFSADTTYFLSDGVTDTQQTGTANWSYAIVRYSVYIPYYVGDTTGSWKLHLTTYGDTGSSTPQFVLA